MGTRSAATLLLQQPHAQIPLPVLQCQALQRRATAYMMEFRDNVAVCLGMCCLQAVGGSLR